MFDAKIKTPKGFIRLNLDGLVLRRGDTYVHLTPQEYAWLPVYHKRGQDLTIASESGEVTFMPNIADAIVSLISHIRNVDC